MGFGFIPDPIEPSAPKYLLDLTGKYGKVIVNVAYLAAVSTSDVGETVLYISNGPPLIVSESVNEIRRFIEAGNHLTQRP
jgi:hypothetical protein